MVDLSMLQDFEINVDPEWSDWTFKHEEYENIPLTFFNRFNKGLIKCCDLSAIPVKKQDLEFTIVEGNTKVTNLNYISKNIKMGDRRKNTQASTRTFTKKQKRNIRTWHTQYKTKFKEITAKNDWIVVKSMNKRDLSENIPKVTKVKFQHIKTVGKLRKLNEKVEKISWNPTGFKQNEEYKITPATTMEEPFLSNKAIELFNEGAVKKSLVCSKEFLLALMTVRGGQYPWNILIEKQGNVIIFENYQPNLEEEKELSYLDLFTTNENTTGNMPGDESKVKDQCVNATKFTKIFRDLIASGDYVETEESDEEEEIQEKVQEENQEENQNQEDDTLKDIDFQRKYVKIQLDDIDIYTNVDIDGVKQKNGELEKCLIRAFMETNSDGGWIEDIKKSQGTLLFQEYLANCCSLQKWICEGNLAEVEMIKLGFIGFSKQKPLLINVTETNLKVLESSISFKFSECWPIVKYILDILYKCDNGQFILSRAPYSPLSLKLFKLPAKEEEPEEEAN